MRTAKVSYVNSVKSEANKWSVREDLILSMMLGDFTFNEIALRLGRTASAVQRRASRKGLTPRQPAANPEEVAARAEALDQVRLEEDLSAYVVECDEDPVLPHTGGRAYHREYKRARKEEDS